MAQKYRKIDPRIWRDERFSALSLDEKLVAIYCLTAQVNRCGIFVFSPAMAAEELGTSPQTFRECFDRVISALRWRWDSERRVLFFPRWWRYNTPENPNVLKGNLTDLLDLPETPLLKDFYGNTGDLDETLRNILSDTFGKRYPKPSPNQEQEQEQEQDTISAASPPKKKRARKESKKPRQPDPLFDAVAEVTHTDSKVSASHVGGVCAELKKGEPPYTPEEVRLFASRFREFCPWAKDRSHPELGELQKHIGKVRASNGYHPQPPPRLPNPLTVNPPRAEPMFPPKESRNGPPAAE